MHSILHQWACEWGHSQHSVLDLMTRLGMGFEPAKFAELEGWSEAAIQNRVRIDAGKVGILAWRNNVGAFQDNSGAWRRFGLCNDSKQLNERVKSSDLIGIKPLLITPAHLGMIVGQFYAREVKEYGWKYTGNAHEAAQAKFGQIVLSKGGDFKFTIGEV